MCNFHAVFVGSAVSKFKNPPVIATPRRWRSAEVSGGFELNFPIDNHPPSTSNPSMNSLRLQLYYLNVFFSGLG
jgi:hypothetical protein